MAHPFLYGTLTGAGALALAQNLFDYRIDEFVIEKIYTPVKHFVLAVVEIFRKKKA